MRTGIRLVRVERQGGERCDTPCCSTRTREGPPAMSGGLSAELEQGQALLDRLPMTSLQHPAGHMMPLLQTMFRRASSPNRRATWTFGSAVILLALTACGGGGGGSAAQDLRWDVGTWDLDTWDERAGLGPNSAVRQAPERPASAAK